MRKRRSCPSRSGHSPAGRGLRGQAESRQSGSWWGWSSLLRATARSNVSARPSSSKFITFPSMELQPVSRKQSQRAWGVIRVKPTRQDRITAKCPQEKPLEGEFLDRTDRPTQTLRRPGAREIDRGRSQQTKPSTAGRPDRTLTSPKSMTCSNLGSEGLSWKSSRRIDRYRRRLSTRRSPGGARLSHVMGEV